MKVLYVEDEEHDADLARRALTRLAPPIHLEVVSTLREARARLADPTEFDLVLLDYRLPDGNGLDLLEEIQKKGLSLAVVILTGLGDEEIAVAALKAGADDYLTKREGYLSKLPLALENAWERFKAEAVRRAGILNILYAEHSPADVDLTRRHLARHAPQLRLEAVYSADEALHRLPLTNKEPCPWDVVLLDYRLPGLNALEALKVIIDERRLGLPVVLVTGQGDEEVAARALRLGAADYLVKHPRYLFELPATLENAYHRFQLAREQAALRARETKFRSIFENIQDVYYEVTLEGIIDEISPSIEMLSGGQYRREDLIGKSMGDFYPVPLERERLIQALLEQGTLMDYEISLKNRDGRLIHCSLSSRMEKDAQGNPVKIIGILRDITIRKQNEERLRESEERLRLALVAANQGLYDLNLQTCEAVVSPEYARMLGYDPGELQETNTQWRDRLHPDDREEVTRIYEECIGGRRDDYRVEFRQQTKSGDWKWILSLGRVVEWDAEERPLRMLGTHTDISDLKKAEERRDRAESELRQAQKMEAVGRLAGGVAHDFNNMLSVILGYTDMALSRLKPQDPLAQDLREVHQAGRRSADLVRQLLAFSRKQIVTPQAVLLNEVIKEQQKMLGRLIGEDITLQFIPGPDLWNLWIDPSQIDQIMANLAVNARDAIAGVGTITIETANVTLDDPYTRRHPHIIPGNYVMLALSDSGVGMSPETLERIFEPFFTTKEEGQGTGLGLSMVYGIVKQNRGAIHAYSEPGQGTTFKLYFPRFEGEAAEPAKRPVQRPLKGDETILIVEDENQILLLAKQILEQQGYQVLTAESPEKALTVAGQFPGPVHLLLTDVIMPGMNGKELRDKIEAIKPGIKTAFMSGYTADAIAHRGILDEGVAFVEKPFSVRGLSEKIREVLES
jgi:PAS domain S-box-containing protein